MSGKAIVLIILACICVGLWIWWYIDSERQYNQRRTQLEQFKQQLKPGVVIVNTFEHENPFIPTAYDRFKILDVKKGWCSYISADCSTKSDIEYDTIENLFIVGFKIEKSCGEYQNQENQ